LDLDVEGTQQVGVYPVRQNAKQQMARQVARCSPAKHCVPAGLECADIETAQTRDLDIERLAVWRRRTDCLPGHAA
jgi:hypothetical protein